jgi:adenosylcobinamide-phosphate synthase
MLSLALSAVAAVLLDWLLGEPGRWHPLVGFGKLVKQLERIIYGAERASSGERRLRGILGVLILVLPITLIAAVFVMLPYIGNVIGILLLYFALGHKSLHQHASPVAEALRNGDDTLARHLASRIVSRDPEQLDIPLATTESVLENGNDGVFGALFWFVIAGGAGVVLYRLVNTLDAMWGYRNDRYRYFGWAAARLDDLLNYIPARLTALTYALLGMPVSALSCWRTQAAVWDSPNAGPVMAAGAGALGVALGGPACYRGEWHQRPQLGRGHPPQSNDIERALRLVRNGVLLWLAVLVIAGGLMTYA